VDEFQRQLTELHNLNTLRSDYQKTLLLLGALKAGIIGLDFITLTESGWQLTPPEVSTEVPPEIVDDP
jgi:hypothetical protein